MIDWDQVQWIHAVNDLRPGDYTWVQTMRPDRRCRLAVYHPELLRWQCEAKTLAACISKYRALIRHNYVADTVFGRYTH